jgi:hypothetical protein
MAGGVERFSVRPERLGADPNIFSYHDGEWVRFSDYEKLKTERDDAECRPLPGELYLALRERDQAVKRAEELREERRWADEITRIAAWESLTDLIRQEIGDRMTVLIAERNRWAKRADKAEAERDQARQQVLEEVREAVERLRWRECPKCHGSGVYDEHQCPRCEGTGRIEELLDAAELLATLDSSKEVEGDGE